MAEILLRITLLITFMVTESNIIPLYLLQFDKSPFLGSLTIRPVFQKVGISSDTFITGEIMRCTSMIFCTDLMYHYIYIAIYRVGYQLYHTPSRRQYVLLKNSMILH